VGLAAPMPREDTKVMTNYLQSTTTLQRVIFVIYALALVGSLIALIWHIIPWWPFGISLALAVVANMFLNMSPRAKHPQENDPTRR
jgi:hypothetical protein